MTEQEILAQCVTTKTVFEMPRQPDRGYTVRASYLRPPHQKNALVEIRKGGQTVRRYLFPVYKIWNVKAHLADIITEEITRSGGTAV